MLIRAVVAAAFISIAAPALVEPENTNWPNFHEGEFMITDPQIRQRRDPASSETALSDSRLCGAQRRRRDRQRRTAVAGNTGTGAQDDEGPA
jgi:hypothetical protein